MYENSLRKTRVFVNGTFDVLHPGHIRLLKAAKALGSFLLVGIDSDARVQKLKGHLPKIPQRDRKSMLMAIEAVDHVEIFDSDSDLIELISEFNPYCMVKGTDYLNKPIIGSNLVQELYWVHKDHYSSSNL